MSNVHYFQRFAAEENVATNNTMLLLKRLYQYSTLKFEEFLDQLLGGQNLSIGPRFTQQERGPGGNSIPDGSIRQRSFRILIETKLHKGIPRQQIEGHLKHFENEEIQVMLTISPRELDYKRKKELEELVNSYNDNGGRKVVLAMTTFQLIIESMYATISENRDLTMFEIVGDYGLFCKDSGLLPDDKDKLRAIVAGKSFEECLEYNVYYNLAERGYTPHTYIGLYRQKKIEAIGKIERIVEADLDPVTNLLVIKDSEVQLSDDQVQRIKAVMQIGSARGWGVTKGHRFFLVEKFHKTDFRKSSSGGLWGTKYFSLNGYFEEHVKKHHELPSVEDITNVLRSKTWE
jgi:hypothetical protein